MIEQPNEEDIQKVADELARFAWNFCSHLAERSDPLIIELRHHLEASGLQLPEPRSALTRERACGMA